MSCFKMLYWIEDMRVVLFKWAFCVISKQCYRECSENIKRKKKHLYWEVFLLKNRTVKGQCWSLQIYLVKAPLICTVPNVTNAIKMIFGRKEKKNHLDFISLLMYCCDQPNA